MRCVFGIDVSKDTFNVAIVIDQAMFREMKLPLNRDGLKLCNLLAIPRLFLRQQVFIHDGFSASLMILIRTIPASTR